MYCATRRDNSSMRALNDSGGISLLHVAKVSATVGQASPAHEALLTAPLPAPLCVAGGAPPEAPLPLETPNKGGARTGRGGCGGTPKLSATTSSAASTLAIPGAALKGLLSIAFGASEWATFCTGRHGAVARRGSATRY